MRLLLCCGLVLLLLQACTSPQAPAPQVPAQPAQSAAPVAPRPSFLPHYRCDGAPDFDVRFAEGSADLLFANGERETLLRDAGGTSPAQTVFSSTAMKVEFGLDPQERGAKLHRVSPPVEARCTRE